MFIHKNAESTSDSLFHMTIKPLLQNIQCYFQTHTASTATSQDWQNPSCQRFKVPFARSSFKRCKQRCSAYEPFAKTQKQTCQNARFVRENAKTQKPTLHDERAVRDICKTAEANRPKRAFRARHSQKRRSKPPKTNVSRDNKQKQTCQNERFVQKPTSQNERFVPDIRKKQK